MKYRSGHLDDNVGLGLLRLDVRGEVGLAAVDGRLHLLGRGAALSDVALRLPGELDVVLRRVGGGGGRPRMQVCRARRDVCTGVSG